MTHELFETLIFSLAFMLFLKRNFSKWMLRSGAFEKASKSKNKTRRLLNKTNRELSKPKSDLKRILRWQTKSAKLINNGAKFMTKKQPAKSKTKKSQTK